MKFCLSLFRVFRYHHTKCAEWEFSLFTYKIYIKIILRRSIVSEKHTKGVWCHKFSVSLSCIIVNLTENKAYIAKLPNGIYYRSLTTAPCWCLLKQFRMVEIHLHIRRKYTIHLFWNYSKFITSYIAYNLGTFFIF